VLLLIVVVALISGIHSTFMLLKLRKEDTEMSKDIKFVLASFNVLISLVSIFAIFIILQFDVNSIVKHAGELLAQLNK
jgi:cytochrome c biogenesis factor